MRDEYVDADGEGAVRAPLSFEPTGVPGLDLVLGGGVQRGSLALVLGPPGSGKTTLASQIAFIAAHAGRRALIVTALSEAPTKLLTHLSNFSFFDRALVGDRLQVHSLGALAARSEGGTAETTQALIEAARALRVNYVMLDGFSGLRPAGDETPGARLLLYELGTTLGAMGITTVVTSVADPTVPASFSEATTADVIIGLRYFVREAHARRALEAIKVRGAAQLTGLHGLALTFDGVSVWPRLEARVTALRAALSVTEPLPPPSTAPVSRVPFDLPELDSLLGGGITRGTSTLLAGSLGTGKTLLGLHFAVAGLRAGEPVVYISLQESREQVLLKADLFSLGETLRAALDDGRLVLDALDPIELDPDETADRILAALDRTRAQRLVLDTISDIERIVAEASGGRGRVEGYLVALLRALRGRGITGLFTRPITRLVASDIEFTDAAVSVLAENVLLLQQVPTHGRLSRALSVIKMSFSAHDTSVREITITPDQGIRVLQPDESEPGVLQGITRAGKTDASRRKRAGGGHAPA